MAPERGAAAALIAVAALAAGLANAKEPAPAQEPPAERREGAARLMDELMKGEGVGGDFTLRDPRGKPRRLAEFRGKVVLLYFGFVTCPDICPTDLLAMGRAIRALGDEGRAVQPIFVTLDPARDTPAVIGEYVANFHPRFLALTGTEAEIRKVAGAYKVFFEKVPLAPGSGYTIDHTAFLYLIDRRGRYAGFLPPATPYDRIARLLHAELRGTGTGAAR